MMKISRAKVEPGHLFLSIELHEESAKPESQKAKSL